MRHRSFSTILALPLLAGLLAGCGDDSSPTATGSLKAEQLLGVWRIERLGEEGCFPDAVEIDIEMVDAGADSIFFSGRGWNLDEQQQRVGKSATITGGADPDTREVVIHLSVVEHVEGTLTAADRIEGVWRRDEHLCVRQAVARRL